MSHGQYETAFSCPIEVDFMRGGPHPRRVCAPSFHPSLLFHALLRYYKRNVGTTTSAGLGLALLRAKKSYDDFAEGEL